MASPKSLRQGTVRRHRAQVCQVQVRGNSAKLLQKLKNRTLQVLERKGF